MLLSDLVYQTHWCASNMSSQSTVVYPPLTHYRNLTVQQFRDELSQSGLQVIPQFDGPLRIPPSGIYVSPRTTNKFFEYSTGVIDDYIFEHYITEAIVDLPMATARYIAVFALQLPRPVVPLYLESRTTFTANSIMDIAGVPVLTGIDSVRLEGDFSEFFRVYSQEQRPLDAFMTIMPDLMVTMLERGSGYDIEFADRCVYFYLPLDHTTGGSQRGESYNRASITSAEFLALRTFALKYGKKFIRAAQPSRSEHPQHKSPLWQIVKANRFANLKIQLKWLAGILIYMAILLFWWQIFMPITVALLSVRYMQWRHRRSRLIANWTSRVGGDPED